MTFYGPVAQWIRALASGARRKSLLYLQQLTASKQPLTLCLGGRMDKLFEQFLNEKLYLKGVSKQTIQWYHYSFKAFKKSLTGDITKQMLADFVIELRKSGVSTTTMNDYIRGVNVFLGWLYEDEYIPKVLKIKRVKQEETIIETFDTG
jgi:site-specific recombinase XerD